ncbi:MAG TPA: CDP-glycerol glycerophosphotransferase family protein [Candidatus Limnocylindria bacterium]
MARGFARRSITGIVYRLVHVLPRSKRVWVFGNLKGFRDNPRYLAEHIVATHPEIDGWWVARTPAEAAAARAAGLSVAMLGTARAARVQLRAGAAFLSNAFIDLQPAFLGGALVVHLYHGLGLKRILLDIDVDRLMRGAWPTRAMTRLQRWSVRRQLGRVDLIIAAGGFAAEHFASGFGLPPARIPVLGSPRFDVIEGGPAFARLASPNLRARLGVPEDAHLVLWLPTWRERGDAAWLPPLDGSTLDRELAGTKVRLVVKTHPYADISVFSSRLPDHERIRLLGETEIDVNCLLRMADALVTDYSSAAFDYAILRRPMHFFAPDAEAFDRSRGLYQPFSSLTGGTHHVEWQPLLRALAAGSRGQDLDGMASMERVARIAANNEEPGSSERIVQLVSSRVGLGSEGPDGRG